MSQSLKYRLECEPDVTNKQLVIHLAGTRGTKHIGALFHFELAPRTISTFLALTLSKHVTIKMIYDRKYSVYFEL